MYYWYIADLLENYWALGHVSWDGNDYVRTLSALASVRRDMQATLLLN